MSNSLSTMKCLEASIEVKKSEFQAAVLRWAESNIRRYPWRNKCRSPYEIMVAELLLKRTTAPAAARIYEHFLRKYPGVDALAQATEEELAQDFKPVGLYAQRAKAVTKLAQHLIAQEAGSIPSTLDRLIKTPGLGSYSARAVLSFGYGRPSAVVDANVVRVLTRVFQQDMPERPTTNLLQKLADTVLLEKSHREFNFALLDLGALVCRYAKPYCNLCPLFDVCDYTNVEQGSPRPKETVSSRVRQTRRDKGYSLVTLAENSKVSKLTIINIEAGRTNPRPDTLRKLAEALDVPMDVLAGP